MGSYQVVADWDATYDDPILLKQGEEFWLTGKTDNWEGHVWVWAKNQVGREGWIPDSLANRIGSKTYAATDFSALELTCRRGEDLHGRAETHGWVLCKNAAGLEGWVPAKKSKKNSKSLEI